MSDGEPDRGMSTTAKVLIAVCAAGCLGLALCCGGGYIVWLRAKQVVGEFADAVESAATQNPAEVRALTDSMVSIEVPEGWQPVSGMQWTFGVEMTMAMYSPNQMQPNRMLMLMQMKGGGADQQQVEQQMRMQSQQQGMNPQFGQRSSETRTFVIDGEERTFQFIVSTDNAGNTVHQVTGMFPGRNGFVMLTLMEDDANWDEDVVVRMIESITTETTAGTGEETADSPEVIDSPPETTETPPETAEE